MARILGPRNPVMPPFINIGQRLEGIGENEEIKAFTTAGFFGTEFGPMNLPYPEDAAKSVRPPPGMQPGRFADRYKFYKQLVDRSPHREYMSDHQQESMLRALDSAQRLLSAKERDAFDITPGAERELREIQHRAASARAVCSRGGSSKPVPATSKSPPNTSPSSTGTRTPAAMKQSIGSTKKSTAQSRRLILDLESRGLLDRTLVVLASEFSRDMIIEGVPGSEAKDQTTFKVDKLEEMKHYGLHRHFTGLRPWPSSAAA